MHNTAQLLLNSHALKFHTATKSRKSLLQDKLGRICFSLMSLVTASLTSPMVLAQTGTVPPLELNDWYLTLPIDDDKNGKADTISETQLVKGWTDKRFFIPPRMVDWFFERLSQAPKHQKTQITSEQSSGKCCDAGIQR